MRKSVRSHVLAGAIYIALFALAPRAMAALLVCGAYDVSRNRPLTLFVVDRYFFGNGILTWALSPFNTLTDILALPYRNKGVYQLEDLPAGHQAEIQRLLDAAHHEDLVAKLEARTSEARRSMVFFKWYGRNIDHSVEAPSFHEPYRYVKTIGVSVFNKRQSTSKHFGPFRATIRVLYNINQMTDDSAYIVVGGVTNYWRRQPLFIFDDTLQHQSFNETDQARYCLFVDILRPALIPQPLSGIVNSVRFFLRGVNYIFYRNWEVVKG
ncbi:MAG TPA: aspartyl/asparaginyl beta-hydroxylase domain-containing protein [Armatimonadota bacterium]|jgi:beta-hydroxylase